MFNIIFYHEKNKTSDIEKYLNNLTAKAKTDKTARINRNKILTYLKALATYGTRIGEPFVKHIDGDIWELRPLNNRIFFFYWKDNKFVLLHYFIKKTQKMPPRELEKAKQNLKNFLERSKNYEH